MPIRTCAFDQKGNCARVIYCGLGERMASRSRPQALAEQIARLLADQAAKHRVEQLAREVRHAGGTPRAADIVEQAITPAASRIDASTFVEPPGRRGIG